MKRLLRIPPSSLFIALLIAPLLGCESCLKRVPMADGIELGELPQCVHRDADEELVRRSLVAGPDALEKTIEERYRLYRRGDCIVGESYVNWRMGDIAQIIVWDAHSLQLSSPSNALAFSIPRFHPMSALTAFAARSV